MDKNKKQILILICLLAFIVNYSVYTYYVAPQLQKIQSSKKSYEEKLTKLNSLEKEKTKIDSLKKNIAELKVESEKLDTMVPNEIDTPKLIYDFYNFCNTYGVTGDSVKFQLQEGSEPQGATGKENTNQSVQEKIKEEVKQKVNEYTNGNTKENSNSNGLAKNSSLTLISLTIDLSVKGNKGNIGTMLNNLNNITDRKLNVKNIVLATAENQQNNGSNGSNNIINDSNTTNSQTSKNVNSVKTTKDNSVNPLNLTYKVPLTTNNIKKVEKVMMNNGVRLYAGGVVKSSDVKSANNSLNDNSQDIEMPNSTSDSTQNRNSLQGGNGASKVNPDEMTADVIFVQYIQISNENYEKFKNYPFFDDSDKGFQSFSDMFK